jgi:hypothetical protein
MVMGGARRGAPYVFSVLLTFCSFVGKFVGNFVEAIYVWEKAVKLGKVFDEVARRSSRRSDERRKGSLNKYLRSAARPTH